MNKKRIGLVEAVRFHGHLGPYLVLGVLAGEFALSKLCAKKYFGIDIKVWGANKKPKSCLIDGLQLSTGATYGKGNIQKLNGRLIKIMISDTKANRSVILRLSDNLVARLEALKSHRDSELFARELFREKKYSLLFELRGHR